jgi:energy-coupling factor transport system substrate-specific component
MKLTIRETAIFGMLGAVMYASKIIMEFIPNVHLLGVFTVAFTVVYRKKALYPIYTYVILNGVFSGFTAWWVPYLYLWTVLWGAVMLLPKKMPKKIQPVVYMSVCAAHGFLFGTLYAPAQAVIYGLSFKGMVAWIIAGLPWDCIHGVSNFLCGILILPIASALRLAERNMGKKE